MPGISAVPGYCAALKVEAEAMRETLAAGPT
jgi:hypothetical protein